MLGNLVVLKINSLFIKKKGEMDAADADAADAKFSLKNKRFSLKTKGFH